MAQHESQCEERWKTTFNRLMDIEDSIRRVESKIMMGRSPHPKASRASRQQSTGSGGTTHSAKSGDGESAGEREEVVDASRRVLLVMLLDDRLGSLVGSWLRCSS